MNKTECVDLPHVRREIQYYFLFLFEPLLLALPGYYFYFNNILYFFQ